MTHLLNHTLFINLDHRRDRLEHVLMEFVKMDIIGHERFPAVKMSQGNVGCTISHIRCLELAKSRGWPHVFICEDDITFTNPAVLKNSLEKFAKSGIEWDVIVIGGNNCPPYVPVSDFCARVTNVQTTTGYIVKKEYYDILLDNFRMGLEKLMREPERKKEFSLDIYWKQLQTANRWFMILPLTVVQYYDYSDIEQRVTDYRPAMLDFDKKELIERFMKEQENKRKKVMNFNV
jgi:GR25 family glycosyltransferase involved in LPS biosynthesis